MSRAFRPDALQVAVEAGDLALAVREHDRLRDRLLADQPDQGAPLQLAARCRHQHRVDRVDRGRRAADLDPGRVAQELLDDPAHAGRHGGGEQQRLPPAGEQGQDTLDIGHEAHVEHPVGLVDHEDVDAAEQHLAAVEPVEQAAGGRDQDVDAPLQRLLLVAHADAADQQRHGQVEMLAVDLEILRRLGRELARRRDDHRARHPRPGPAVGQDMQHRQDERGRLAGAGLGDADHVAAGQHHRDGPGLDGGGLGVARVGDGPEDRLVETEVRKADGKHFCSCQGETVPIIL